MENKLQVHYRSEENYVEKIAALDMSKTKPSKNNVALPGPPLDPAEFRKMIKDAEKGPFHSIRTLKEDITKWKAKRSK